MREVFQGQHAGSLALRGGDHAGCYLFERSVHDVRELVRTGVHGPELTVSAPARTGVAVLDGAAAMTCFE